MHSMGQRKISNNDFSHYVNPISLRNAKIVYNFGLSECNRVKQPYGLN